MAFVLAASADAQQTTGAETFSWQLAGTLRNAEQPSDAEVETGDLKATYFFAPVDSSGVPPALAPFLSRSSYIAVGADRIEPSQRFSIESPFGGTPANTPNGYDATRVSAEGRYIERETGWFVGGGFRWYEPFEYRSELLDLDIDSHDVGVVGGKYIGQSTSIELAISAARSKQTSDFAGCTPPQCVYYGPPDFGRPSLTESTRDSDDVTLSFTHVGGSDALPYSITGRLLSRNATGAQTVTYLDGQPIDGEALLGVSPGVGGGFGLVPAGGVVPSYPIQAEYGLDRDLQALEFIGELYPRPSIGIRLGLTTFDDTSLDTRVEVGAAWFFRPAIALEVGFARLDYASRRDFDRDEALLRLIGRF